MEDRKTQRDAQHLAREYNIVPYKPLKCERVIGRGDDICSIFFANTSNRAKNFTQYHSDQIAKWDVDGEACNKCWDAGKLWADETPPKFAFCGLWGFDDPVEFLNTVFEPGDPVKPGVYVLEQKNCPNCTYELLDDEKEIIWTPDDTTSTLVVTTKPDNIVRMNASAGGCFKLFQENSRGAEINYGRK